MAGHPANLALRFLLEIAALTGLSRWVHAATASALPTWARIAAAIAAAVAAAAAWGTFAVPGDPSRSGNAPVPIPGAVRLVLELVILGTGAYGFVASGARSLGVAFVVLIVVHHALSVERIRWLLAH